MYYLCVNESSCSWLERNFCDFPDVQIKQTNDQTRVTLFRNMHVAGRISSKLFIAASEIFKSPCLRSCSSVLYCGMENYN